MAVIDRSEADVSAGKKGGTNRIPDNISFGGCVWEAFSSLAARLLIISVLLDTVNILLGRLGYAPEFSSYWRMIVTAAAAAIITFAGAALRYAPRKTLREELCPYPKGNYRVSRGIDDIQEVPASEIAVGDVVFLSDGEIVPADGILIDGSFTAEQSALGHPAVVEKTAAPYGYGKTVTDPKDPYSVFAGSAVNKGKAAALITAAGEDTAYAKRLGDFFPEIPEKAFSGFIRFAAVIGIVSTAAAAVSGILKGISSGGLMGNIISGLSAMSAVLAVICAGGRTVVYEALAAESIKKLKKDDIAVNKGECLVTAGDTDVVMTGREGMITVGEYAFSGFIDGSGKEYHSFAEAGEKLTGYVRTAVFSMFRIRNGIGSALAGAVGGEDSAAAKKQSEASENGVQGVTVTMNGSLVTVIKGDPETVLDRCPEYLDKNGRRSRITNKDALGKLIDTILMSGKDIVAFALSDTGIKGGRLPDRGYVLVGFAALQDKYPEEAAQAVQDLEKMGVRTILVTSSSRRNAVFTVRSAGIKKSGGVVIDRKQFEKMDPARAAERFDSINAAAGFEGKDKTRLVKTAKLNGKKVLFAGNDPQDKNAFGAADTSFASVTAPPSLSGSCGAAAGKLGIVCAGKLISASRRFSAGYKAFIIIRMLAAAGLCAAAVLIGW